MGMIYFQHIVMIINELVLINVVQYLKKWNTKFEQYHNEHHAPTVL